MCIIFFVFKNVLFLFLPCSAINEEIKSNLLLPWHLWIKIYDSNTALIVNQLPTSQEFRRPCWMWRDSWADSGRDFWVLFYTFFVYWIVVKFTWYFPQGISDHAVEPYAKPVAANAREVNGRGERYQCQHFFTKFMLPAFYNVTIIELLLFCQWMIVAMEYK